MDRYVNVTEARKDLLELVDHLEGADRVVITKRGQPRVVMVDFDRYALLEDVAWVLQDPGRRTAMLRAWEEWKSGDLLASKGRAPTVQSLRDLSRRPRSRKKS